MPTDGEKQNIRIWRRDKFKCAYCHMDMSQGRETELLVSDHIDPRTKIQYPPGDFGVEHDLEKTTACTPCNQYKHRFLPPAGFSRSEKIKAGREYVKLQRQKHFKWIQGIIVSLL